MKQNMFHYFNDVSDNCTTAHRLTCNIKNIFTDIFLNLWKKLACLSNSYLK